MSSPSLLPSAFLPTTHIVASCDGKLRGMESNPEEIAKERFLKSVETFAVCAVIGSLFTIPVLGWTAPIVTVASLLLGATIVNKLPK